MFYSLFYVVNVYAELCASTKKEIMLKNKYMYVFTI